MSTLYLMAYHNGSEPYYFIVGEDGRHKFPPHNLYQLLKKITPPAFETDVPEEVVQRTKSFSKPGKYVRAPDQDTINEKIQKTLKQIEGESRHKAVRK